MRSKSTTVEKNSAPASALASRAEAWRSCCRRSPSIRKLRLDPVSTSTPLRGCRRACIQDRDVKGAGDDAADSTVEVAGVADKLHHRRRRGHVFQRLQYRGSPHMRFSCSRPPGYEWIPWLQYASAGCPRISGNRLKELWNAGRRVGILLPAGFRGAVWRMAYWISSVWFARPIFSMMRVCGVRS